MKTKFLFLVLLSFLFISFTNAQQNSIGPGNDLHPNKITIRNDRVFMLNGNPYFPIGVCFELDSAVYESELIKSQNPRQTYGFNFINLFAQNAWLYNCGTSKNVISGDLSISQFSDILSAYWPTNLTGQDNYNRIKRYLDNGVYLLADDNTFIPDDATYNRSNNGILNCSDSIWIIPPFNQTVRNDGIDRVNTIALQSDSKLIGFYSSDDANMFQTAPQPPMWYYNTYRKSKMQNLQDSYNHAKSDYAKSMVLMSLPPTFFPRMEDPTNPLWNTSNAARDLWVNDAIEFSKGANVLFSPGYMTMENPSWGTEWRIYDDGYPKCYPQHIKETLIDRVLSTSTEPKAILGGVIFDHYESNPLTNDPSMDDKVKWQIYVGLQKGATGLIFFGWHLVLNFPYIYRPIWDAIRNQVDTLVNVKGISNVFTRSNLGPVGHSVTGNSTSGDVSYCVYQNPGDIDYFLLVTNNPTGSLFATPDAPNTVDIYNPNWNANNIIINVFDNPESIMNPDQNGHIQYDMKWFGTALFHVTQKGADLQNKKENANIPKKYYVQQNYPNPFNPTTQISYGLPKSGNVKIQVFNSIGQLITTLTDGYKDAGSYNVTFDGTKYSSGLYIYKITAGNYVETKKMLLVK